MPIPITRQALNELVTSTFEKLESELDGAMPGVGDHPCVDDWTVKDLLVVRAWWTESVAEWIEDGRRGESPTTPAHGYGWNETPRLNADIVSGARNESYAAVRIRLRRGFENVLALIASLDDRELLSPEAFPWAGKWPVSRWISINTARQYVTARTFIRRALRD
jgi:hypothetical protein